MPVASASITAEPPAIAGVRRSFVEARGVRFHVTESGPVDGRPVIALHGWPQHHWLYRELLADPPPGLRIIAPDLPGYGWSGPAPHQWAKEDVASDVLALADALGLERFLLLGHDWGGYVGHLMVLRAPERIDGYLVLNMLHPWAPAKAVLPHMWRFLFYIPWVASFGVWLQSRTSWMENVLYRFGAPKVPRDIARVYCERYRDPVVARAGRDTYRTFVLREFVPMLKPDPRRAKPPIRALFGRFDSAVRPSMAATDTANADDYTFELVNAGHFINDERPDLVREKLIALADETATAADRSRVATRTQQPGK